MAVGCAGAALVAAGCGLTNASSKTQTVTVTHTVTHTVTTTAKPPAEAGACTADQLSGTFAVQPGSAGAGNISYTLTLTNTSQTACFVSGIPVVQLLDANGKALPTSATAEQPGTQTAVKATLQPNGSATADSRFSPDVTGVGESGNPCEPVASTLRVTANGGGTLDVKIAPPTSVCSHGAIRFSNLSAG